MFVLLIATLLSTASDESVPSGETNPFELAIDLSGKQGFLGVATSDSADASQTGAVVSRVLEGSPAALAGLQVGDVIVALDGRPITATAELLKAVALYAPDQTLVLRFVRAGEKRTATVTLADRADLKWRLISTDPPRVAGGTMSLEGGGVGGDVHNAGNLLLGGAAETNVFGNFHNLWNGLVEIGLSGEKSFAAAKINGTANLDGILHVAAVGGFEPSAGQKFDIFRDAAGISGRFDKTILPKLKPGLSWRVEYDDLERKQDLDGDGKYDITLVVAGEEVRK